MFLRDFLYNLLSFFCFWQLEEGEAFAFAASECGASQIQQNRNFAKRKLFEIIIIIIIMKACHKNDGRADRTFSHVPRRYCSYVRMLYGFMANINLGNCLNSSVFYN